MPLKILHVIPSIAPHYGGPSKIVVELSSALRNQGHISHIATTDADGNTTLNVTLGSFTDYQGEQIIFFRRKLSESFKYAPDLSRWLTLHVQEYDLIHIHAVFSHSTLAAAKTALRRQIPYVIRPLGTLEPWSMGQKALKKKLAWKLCFKPLVQQAAFVHYTTISEQELTEQSLGLSNGRVISNGLSAAFLSEISSLCDNREYYPNRDRTLLFLSRIAPKKGLEVLLHSFSSLAHNVAEFRHILIIAGKGDFKYVKSLQALTQRLGITERVIWKDWVEGSEKQRILIQADALILPSQQENFGNALLEAMACGTPVITTPVTGLARDIAAHSCGWIVPPTDEAVTEAIKEATKDETIRIQRGRNGRKLVLENYTWTDIAVKLIAYYQAVVEDNKDAHT